MCLETWLCLKSRQLGPWGKEYITQIHLFGDWKIPQSKPIHQISQPFIGGLFTVTPLKTYNHWLGVATWGTPCNAARFLPPYSWPEGFFKRLSGPNLTVAGWPWGRLGENPEKIEIRIGIPLRSTLPDSFSGIPKRNPNHLAPNHQLTISWFFESNHSKCWKNYQINGVWFITNKTKGVFYKELLNGDDHPHKTANSKNKRLFDEFFSQIQKQVEKNGGLCNLLWSWCYCWWRKSCTTKDYDYSIIYRVLTIPNGGGFLSINSGAWSC